MYTQMIFGSGRWWSNWLLFGTDGRMFLEILFHIGGLMQLDLLYVLPLGYKSCICWCLGGSDEAGGWRRRGSAAYNVSREGFNWIVSKYVKTTLVLSSCHGNHFPSLKVGSHLALLYQIVEIALANSCCLLPSLFKMSIKVGIVRAWQGSWKKRLIRKYSADRKVYQYV